MNQMSGDYTQITYNTGPTTTTTINSLACTAAGGPNPPLAPPLLSNQLNANDLYAILKPVIKPHIHDPLKQQHYAPSDSYNLLYLGSILIPYDTLSNASKLTSIRNLIEYFLIKNNTSTMSNLNELNCSAGSQGSSSSSQLAPHVLTHQELNDEMKLLRVNSTSSTHASIVNLKVGSDRVRLTNKTLSLLKANEVLKQQVAQSEIDTSALTRLVEEVEHGESARLG